MCRCPSSAPSAVETYQEQGIDQHYQVEIPRRPIVRRLDIHVGQCQRCGKRIQPRHELQTSDAIGAAASQLVPDVQAMIAMMKDEYGLSYGDLCGLLKTGLAFRSVGAASSRLFSGWPSERCFEQAKDELGMDHFEIRGWRSIHRHLYITQLSRLFCARVHQDLREKKRPSANTSPSSRFATQPRPGSRPRACRGQLGGRSISKRSHASPTINVATNRPASRIREGPAAASAPSASKRIEYPPAHRMTREIHD